MKQTIYCFVLLVLVHHVVGPPPRRENVETHEQEHDENDVNNSDHLEELGIEYNRYLKEVVQALESDPEFREKLEKAEETDIRTGKIASELEYVDHKVRTKLDELKRQELERLRHLAQRENELKNGIDTSKMKIPEHLDHSNPHTFEIEDLRKLIEKTTNDLEVADQKRREEFKEYEMQKEFEKNEKMKALDEEHKKQFEKELKDNETKHRRHAPLHHPGSKQQLEEVWEKQDHMNKQDFDPKVFFHMHDLDGNGYWDPDEVKTLFLKELDKLYEAGAPEDDMRERSEEMERMREHVFKEADKNRDGLIDYQEFLSQTKQPEFEKDNGWETIDQQQIYTHEEYLEFERRRQQEIQRMIQQGLIPQQPVYAPYGYQQPPYQQQFPQGQMAHPQQGHYPQPGMPIPGQVPQQQMRHHQGQPPQQMQHHQGQPPQQMQHHQGQPPQQMQHHQGQIPQGAPQGYPQGQMAPQGYPQGQMAPQGYPQGQMPPQVNPPSQITQQGHPSQQNFKTSQEHLDTNRLPQQGKVSYNTGDGNQLNAGQFAQVHPNQLPNNNNINTMEQKHEEFGKNNLNNKVPQR